MRTNNYLIFYITISLETEEKCIFKEVPTSLLDFEKRVDEVVEFTAVGKGLFVDELNTGGMVDSGIGGKSDDVGGVTLLSVAAVNVVDG